MRIYLMKRSENRRPSFTFGYEEKCGIRHNTTMVRVIAPQLLLQRNCNSANLSIFHNHDLRVRSLNCLKRQTFGISCWPARGFGVSPSISETSDSDSSLVTLTLSSKTARMQDTSYAKLPEFRKWVIRNCPNAGNKSSETARMHKASNVNNGKIWGLL